MLSKRSLWVNKCRVIEDFLYFKFSLRHILVFPCVGIMHAESFSNSLVSIVFISWKEIPIFCFDSTRLLYIQLMSLGFSFSKSSNFAFFFSVLHTSASLALNENWDPYVRDDMEMMLNKIVPEVCCILPSPFNGEHIAELFQSHL